MDLAKRHGLRVLEDAAEAWGMESLVGGSWRKAGAIGDIGIYSFFPTKTLGAYGDAGLMVTGDEELYRRMKSYRVHGSSVKYAHDCVGYNSRLATLQAAILRVKLRTARQSMELRARHAARYTERLSAVPGIRFPAILDQPAARDLWDDAQRLLDRIVDERLLVARGVYGFWPAASDGDDIVVHSDNETRFALLRQQGDYGDSRPNRCLADYGAPGAPEAPRPSSRAAAASPATLPAKAEPGGPPTESASGRRGLVGETWFPPRERAIGDRRHQADCPPSTTSTVPVTKRAASLARYRTASAMSSGRPTRPSGRRAASSCSRCSLTVT